MCRTLFNEAIHARTGRDADASPVVAQLERLEAMLLRGSITQSEFD
jgi:hypothetical protein